MIRLHVLANSDSQADQELKLAVRDRVLEQAEDLYPEDVTLEQAREILEDSLDELRSREKEINSQIEIERFKEVSELLKQRGMTLCDLKELLSSRETQAAGI